MEDDQAVASFEGAPHLGDGEVGKLLAVNVSDYHEDGSSLVSDYHEDGSSKDGSCWADSDEEADGACELDREWRRRREQFYNTGYRDGISAGRNDAAQDGFNHGFKDSVLVGYKWGIVRSITSALAHIPNELMVKLVESDEIRGEFMNLHGAVNSIGTEDALKFFYDDIQRAKSAGESKSIESGVSVNYQSGSEHSDLENYFGKLKLLLEKSPVVDVNLDLNENKSS